MNGCVSMVFLKQHPIGLDMDFTINENVWLHMVGFSGVSRQVITAGFFTALHAPVAWCIANAISTSVLHARHSRSVNPADAGSAEALTVVTYSLLYFLFRALSAPPRNLRKLWFLAPVLTILSTFL
jgi:hypothetical protein